MLNSVLFRFSFVVSPNKHVCYAFLFDRDNGCGMTKKNIKDFARYALGQREQGINPSSGKSMISKFGVGAKNAGFFLGDKVSIITKTAGDENVREFTLDKGEFNRKSELKENVYTGYITSRAVGHQNSPLLGGLGLRVHSGMKDAIEAIERGNAGIDNSFNVILIRLKAENVPKFTSMEMDIITKDLANIYHFYLHPGHIPNELMRNPESPIKKLKGWIGHGMNLIETSGFTTSVDRLSKLRITVKCLTCTEHATEGLSQVDMASS